MKTRNYSKNTEDTLITFSIGRGGRFWNPGHKSYVDQDCPITHYVDDLFLNYSNLSDVMELVREDERLSLIESEICNLITDEDFDSLKMYGITEEQLGEKEYYDGGGNPVGLTEKEAESGVGRINIDNDYDTTFVCRLKDVDESEARLILESNNYVSDDVREYLLNEFDLRSEYEEEVEEEEEEENN